MRCDDELRVLTHHIPDHREQRELALWRERCLRLVQQLQATGHKPRLKELEKTLSAAMPSSSVDFPEPFSPTKNVTGRSSGSAASVRIAGTVNGKASSSPPRRLRVDRWIELTGSTYLMREVFHLTYNVPGYEFNPLGAQRLCRPVVGTGLAVHGRRREGNAMPETHPVAGPRPVGAPPYEPVVRLGTPPASGPVTSRINHPVLLPEPDADDEVSPAPAPAAAVPRSAPKARWYVASGLAGAVLVTALYGLLGSRPASSGGRPGSDAAAGGVAVSDTALLDRRADTLALAISAFTMRASMYDSRRMPCSGLARGLAPGEDGWLSYNLARNDMMTASG